jgi:hypothetical protein
LAEQDVELKGEREMRILIASVILVAAVASASAAAPSLKEFRDSSGSVRTVYRTYINGLRDGFMTANAALNYQRRPMLFCVPRDVGLEPKQLEEMILQTERRFDDVGIDIILFKELQITFPCRSK